MRKRTIGDSFGATPPPALSGSAPLPIDTLAQVEVTSESPERPIEGALSLGETSGWRAGAPGKQRVRILFDTPETVRKMTLKFVETERERTQEFVLMWSPDPDAPPHTILRQQWTFSPAGSTTESETYEVDLENVRVLELVIDPNVGDPTSIASLSEWRIYRDRQDRHS